MAATQPIVSDKEFDGPLKSKVVHKLSRETAREELDTGHLW